MRDAGGSDLGIPDASEKHGKERGDERKGREPRTAARNRPVES